VSLLTPQLSPASCCLIPPRSSHQRHGIIQAHSVAGWKGYRGFPAMKCAFYASENVNQYNSRHPPPPHPNPKDFDIINAAAPCSTCHFEDKTLAFVKGIAITVKDHMNLKETLIPCGIHRGIVYSGTKHLSRMFYHAADPSVT